MPEEKPEAATRSLTIEKKMGFVFLLFLAVVGLVLGVLQIRNTIFAPFALTNEIPSSVKDEVVNDVNALRYRDTDGDGLSDYDEIYVYGTSPYLYDTFGYGISDSEVVKRDLPRCANAGKDCSNESTTVIAPDTSTIAQEYGVEAPSSSEFSPTDLSTLMSNPKLLTSDPKLLRQLLISNGMDKKTLDQLNDSQLILMVNQIMTSSSPPATSTH